MRFIRKDALIEAHHWNPGDPALAALVTGWLTSNRFTFDLVGESPTATLLIRADGGWLARPGDWIIRNEDGRIMTCAPASLETRFDPFEGTTTDEAAALREAAASMRTTLMRICLDITCLTCGRIPGSAVQLLTWDSPHGDERCNLCGSGVDIRERDVTAELAERDLLRATNERLAAQVAALKHERAASP